VHAPHFLREISNHHKLIATNADGNGRTCIECHAFEVVSESHPSESAENERENLKKIFHEPGEGDVSKHAIPNMRSRAMSSSGADFSSR